MFDSTFKKTKISHISASQKNLQSLGAACLAVAYDHTTMDFSGKICSKTNAPLPFLFLHLKIHLMQLMQLPFLAAKDLSLLVLV